jgi:ribosomal protein L7/L12
MAEIALVLSIVALVVALTALAFATNAAVGARPHRPRPNELTSLGLEAGGFGQPVAGQPVMGPLSTPGQPSPAVMAFLQAGKKIEAIKQYRIETGEGLKEAKDAVEAFQRGVR